MIKQANPALIGAFVVGAFALVISGIIIFGKDNFFSEPRRFVVVFDSNVKGLRVGSPVTIQGVQVGSVADMQLLLERKEDGVLVPIVLQIYPDVIGTMGANDHAHLSDDSLAELLVSKGLRAQLQVQSFVTGQLIVELTFHPGTTPVYRDELGVYPEIPSLPTKGGDVANTIGNLVKQVQKIPLTEIADELLATIESAHRLIDKPELGESIDRVNTLVASLQQTVDTLNRDIPVISQQVQGTLTETQKLVVDLDKELPLIRERLTSSLDQLDRTLVSAESSLVNLSQMTAEDSALNYNLSRALNEIRFAARSLRVTSDYIQQHPESLLTGKQQQEK